MSKRSPSEMIELIMSVALIDENIRAVLLNGSRADKNSFCDEYSDFDVVYLVNDIQRYPKDLLWFEQFGEKLIYQFPDLIDGYDFNSRNNFTALMQFKDGNRIDLTLVDVNNIDSLNKDSEPQLVLLNKDKRTDLKKIAYSLAYTIKLPDQFEFSSCVNEFYWVSMYVSKGILRDQIFYAYYHFNDCLLKELLKMLSWKIVLNYNEEVVLGKYYKYIKKYLTEEEYLRLLDCITTSEAMLNWKKLNNIMIYFNEVAKDVATKLLYHYNEKENLEVIEYIEKINK